MKKEKKIKQPAISSDDVIKVLTTDPQKKDFELRDSQENDRIAWPSSEEEETIKKWLNEEKLHYDDE